MTLEHKILDYLKARDGAGFVDVSLVDDNYDMVVETVESLKGRNLITVQRRNPINLRAFGLSNKVLNPIKIKINSRGREYLYHLNNPKKGIPVSPKKKRKFWKLTHFFH